LLSGEQGHTIEAEVDPELRLFGSEKELHSAFGNLVSNAVRYTPAGGKVTLRWFRDERGAHLQVEDTGEGIPADAIPRLTERFYRVDKGRSRESGGTGLGLAIVKHVLNRHEAQLRIDSTPGQGSTFTCDFPPERIV
ncbi:MAG TPA: ATP-binding protein, partial [Gammaproteobacteria bacterium]|nr:ATP-binding protein [Gammaproteobacteria bacterium]